MCKQKVRALVAIALTLFQNGGLIGISLDHSCHVNAFASRTIAAKKVSLSKIMAFQVESISDRTANDIRPVRPIIQRTRFQGILALLAITSANGMQFQSVPVAESLLALVASIFIVSGATDAMERMTSSTTVPYDANGERFDQSSFLGRFLKMLLACDPRLLLYTEEEVRKYHALAYDDWQQVQTTRKITITDGADANEINRLLWEAKRIADSALHPETQEWIPRPFRMSGYLPFNGPICIAMISVSSTVPLLFWSWMNQSQNALINYFNGPKSANSEYDEEELERATSDNIVDGALFESYATAVAAALVVAFGLATYVQSNYSGEEATELLRFISFPSAVIASSLNCYIIRNPEIGTGVPLLNKDAENVFPGETSSVAAARGVYSTTASRAILQMPTYFIPPLILETVVPLKHFLSDNPLMVVPITTFLLLISFGIGLPCAVGIFPQVSSIKADEVEEKFRGLGYTEFYYNKGL
mmetsp:Transcript_37609/g.81198  ORF Transcript_37609/g.81198 Transcript_37609/m.81198 type:complete len:475 (-) Transcript_37609:27-1451(-)